MNSDSFGVASGGSGRSQITPLTGLGTTETLFTVQTDTGTTPLSLLVPQQSALVGSNSPLDPNSNSAVSLGNLGRPGQDYRGSRPYFTAAYFDGRPFTVQFSGKFTTSAIDSVTGHAINIYQTAAANGAQLSTKSTVFSAPSSATLAAGNYSFLINCTLIYDSVSQTLTGEGWSIVGGQYTARSIIGPIASVTSVANLFFFPSVKFNTGAANTITPIEFSLSMI